MLKLWTTTRKVSHTSYLLESSVRVALLLPNQRRDIMNIMIIQQTSGSWKRSADPFVHRNRPTRYSFHNTEHSKYIEKNPQRESDFKKNIPKVLTVLNQHHWSKSKRWHLLHFFVFFFSIAVWFSVLYERETSGKVLLSSRPAVCQNRWGRGQDVLSCVLHCWKIISQWL